LQGLPETSERHQLELFLELANGQALMAVKGLAAPETERAYIRARELCERLGDAPEVFPILVGLWAMSLVRGDLKNAPVLAEQLLRLASVSDDTAPLLYARYTLGTTSYLLGEVPLARRHLEIGISLIEPEFQRLLGFQHLGFDVGVSSLSIDGLAL
jgi:predicted ATPase